MKALEYKGYAIYKSDHVVYIPLQKNLKYEFYNLNNCDECIYFGETIEDCKKQIDEKL